MPNVAGATPVFAPQLIHHTSRFERFQQGNSRKSNFLAQIESNVPVARMPEKKFMPALSGSFHALERVPLPSSAGGRYTLYIPERLPNAWMRAWFSFTIG